MKKLCVALVFALLASRAWAEGSARCERFPACPTAPEFELIKLGQTDHPYYSQRDNKYLCFYLVNPAYLRTVQSRSLGQIAEEVTDLFGGNLVMGPMKLGGNAYLDYYAAQMRL